VHLKTKIGLALVASGIGIFASWSWWTKTRNFVPVDVPVSMAEGTSVTSDFKLNFDGLYLIEIEAEKTIPLETLHCLMAVEADAIRCKGTSSAIGEAWKLASNGQEIGRGGSTDMHSAPVQTDKVARLIGEFRGKAGQSYKLEVTFATDGRSLAAARPRLKVCVANIAHTDLQAASVLAFSVSFICILFGAILLSIGFFARSESGLPESSQ
jgi:hypothetical protein